MSVELLDDEDFSPKADPFIQPRVHVVYAQSHLRFRALLIDIFLVNTLWMLVALLVTNDWEILGVLWLFSFPVYKIILEGLYGKTMGKLIIGIAVVQDAPSHLPINLLVANRRFLLCWPSYLLWLAYMVLPEYTEEIFFKASAVVVVAIFAFTNGNIFVDEKNRTLCDLLAKTVCIRVV